MANWIKAARSESLRATDIDDIAQGLSAAAAYLGQLTHVVGERTNKTFDQARDVVSDAAHDAHETLRDNVLASLVLAAGVGLVIGYLIGRGSDGES